MKKNCVIIGCGWLGQPLGHAISTNGFTVYGGTRNLEKISDLAQHGINGFSIQFEEKGVSLHLDSAVIANTAVLIFSIPPTGFRDYAKCLVEIASLFPTETHLVFASSTGVYLETSETINENATCDENHAVRIAEVALLENFKERLTILRLAGLIGVNRHPVKYFLTKSDIPNGLAPVNLIQLKDVIQAFLIVIESKLMNTFFNVCAPQHPTRMDYYGEIAKLKFGVQLYFLAEGKGKIVDGSKIVKETGFQYNTSIFELY
jgi:nucleoside-diphosphate-sugar epimerase